MKEIAEKNKSLRNKYAESQKDFAKRKRLHDERLEVLKVIEKIITSEKESLKDADKNRAKTLELSKDY